MHNLIFTSICLQFISVGTNNINLNKRTMMKLAIVERSGEYSNFSTFDPFVSTKIFCRFGEHAMNRMIRWLEKNVDTSSQIIDLGCGNGVMSLEMYDVGFKNVLGVDYSSHAIDLAKKLALENDIQDLKFKVILSLTHTH